MRVFIATYRLRDGRRRTLTVLDRSSAGVIVTLIDLYGDQLRRVSARPL